MKTMLIAIAAFLGLTHAFAGERVAARLWKSVQTYDVPTLLQQEASLIGKIVAVRFQYRSDKLRHFQPNWYEASIWQQDPNARRGFSAVQVVVAKKDVPDFKTIATDFRSNVHVTVYGRVEKDPDINIAQLRLLGRKVTTDAAGNATIDW